SGSSADPAVGQRRREAELQHRRHGPQDPALHRVGHVHPHAGARRHPGHGHQSSGAERVHERRRGRARDAGARRPALRRARRPQAHVVARDATGSPAEGPGRNDAPAQRQVREVDVVGMRIATWNVNSLKARLDKVTWWLGRARPDVLLMQETKLADQDAPADAFRAAGYELAHHGQGRWNGVAIASRVGISDVVTNFGQALSPDPTPDVSDDEPMAEARMMSAVCDGVRVVTIYAPNGRVVDSPFYHAKLGWFERLLRWFGEARNPGEALVLGGDFNVAPEDADVWDAAACHGGTHVSPPEREAFARLCRWGLTDAYRLRHREPGRYTWWDYRAGNFHKNFGMRIDHLLVTATVAKRVVDAEIDREARKGKPVPSDHAPLVIDLDTPGSPFDPGWRTT